MPIPVIGAIAKALKGGSIIKDLGDVMDKFVTTPEEKAKAQLELEKVVNSHVEKLAELELEEYKAEVEDRSSARNREVGVAQAGRFDFMMYLAGLAGIAAFGFIIYATVYI